MSNSNLSFHEFDSLKKEDWLGQIERELKGKPFSSIQTEIEEGLILDPAYTEADRPAASPLPPKAQDHLDLVEAVEVSDGKASNPILLDLLNRGTSALLLYLQEGVILKDLLKDVLIQHIAIHYVVEGNGTSVMKQLDEIVRERGLNHADIRGSINIDPFENTIRTGRWFEDEKSDIDNVRRLNEGAFTSLKTMCVNANLYHNAGASTSTELACALAHAHEYIVLFGVENASKVWMNMAIGPNYLVEVAKFRAMRMLWAKLMESYSSSTPLHIYAETGTRNKTVYDPNVNMLRTTTEAMSAIVAGVDEIQVMPYDVVFRSPSNLAKRIARNQALVMQYEAFANKVADPASGSYAIEVLTSQLCERAWNSFREIEAEGGWLASVKKGTIQSKISAEASAEQEKFDNGDLILVGTNKFPNADEKMAEMATQLHFASDQTHGEVVEKVVARRLSEKVERERLKAEQS